jgi:hypothetical protein
MLTDATCYETAMRYPTNVKLLWESVDWCYGQLKRTCKYLKIRTPRTKYLKQKERYGIYATNANRTYCKNQKITHGFKRKGRAGKHEGQRKLLHSVLRKERATRMEGSFGTEKEHYGLKKIRAMT